ncbi:MAG: RtcB family protein [Hyphomicrobiales bacterium]|nr:RtcB family protein [Hyphomicrobiales bacterium]
MSNYLEMTDHGVPVWAWVRGVPVDPAAEAQLRNVAALPFVHHHVAAMPDVHVGIGATIGAVIATRGAIIPAAVGVDIGCGMMALRTDIPAARLPDDLAPLRSDIERAVPHGGFKRGGWSDRVPDRVATLWRDSGLADGLAALEARHPKLAGANSLTHLGTLGGGNHFIEVCLDEDDRVWVMLHSGSRGIGNRIGTHFIALAVRGIEHRDLGFHLPDKDLAFLVEGADPLFDDYLEAVHWAQSFAQANRRVMMERILDVLRRRLPPFRTDKMAVDCHHNYVARERHFGAQVWVTRKGAVHAGKGELGIIPGSMGARSYIVRGKGNPDSFRSCSHGAGRVMSRHEARRRFTVEDHRRATAGVECRKDRQVVDETPMAYKDIDAVMAAQADLVEVVHTLRQVVCVKG